MACHSFSNEDGGIRGHICLIDIYRYEGLVFEYHAWNGYTQYKKDANMPRIRYSKNFYEVVGRFDKLSDDEKKKYLIYG